MVRCIRLLQGVFAVCLVCVLLLVMMSLTPESRDSLSPRGFLVDTPACRILDLDPFDNSIAHLVHLHGKLECKGQASITYNDGDMLCINRTKIQSFYNGSFDYCRYQSIYRGPTQSDYEFTLGNLSAKFNTTIRVNVLALKVFCYDKSDHVIYTNYHSLIIPNITLDKVRDQTHQQYLSQNKTKEVLNVVMLGVDSVSRLNSIRQMPLTRKYLLENMGAIELEGYTKVALNTFVNIVPMTTGMFVDELPWYGPMGERHFDNYSYIWKNFSQSGYRTMYAEDAPNMGIFTYIKKGFHKPPTDHYNRAFSDALEKDSKMWSSANCVGDRLETDIVLKYVEDFIRLYKDKPHFAFGFITRLTHADFNQIGGADDPHHRFLQRVHSSNLLNNTVLIYFSDHGIRFGSVRNSLAGRLEDRLPFVFFIFPKWFKEKYPKVINNLKTNTKRLTTPFDMHETLKDILHFTGNTKIGDVNKRGISLFDVIPPDRSCDHAAILEHWCVCLERETISVEDEHVVKSANNIVQNINNLLKNYTDICVVLKLKEITSAVALVTNNRLQHPERKWYDLKNLFPDHVLAPPQTIQLTLVTSPGDAMFEVTVSMQEMTQQYVVTGDISRINKYGNTSACVNDFFLRNYCLCR